MKTMIISVLMSLENTQVGHLGVWGLTLSSCL